MQPCPRPPADLDFFQKLCARQRLTPLEKVEKSKMSKSPAKSREAKADPFEKTHTCREKPISHWHPPKRKFGISKQIMEDRAEPQQIVATRPLYCLQHPLPIQVVCKRFFPAHIGIAIHEVDSRPFRPLPVPRQLWYTSIRDALFLLISYQRDQHHRFQHRFWLRGVQPLSSVW